MWLNNDAMTVQDKIETITQRINNNKAEEEYIGTEIKIEYMYIDSKLQASGNIITKEVDQHYKNIDRLFGQKHEYIVRQANDKRALLRLLGVL